jgi:SAM-dependent methyltransferase
MDQFLETVYPLLACPGECKFPLICCGEKLVCDNPRCKKEYPVIGGVPVVINSGNSLFSIKDFTLAKPSTEETRLPLNLRLWRMLYRFRPTISMNIVAARNYQQFRDLLLRETPHPVVLIVGAGGLGEGLEGFIEDSRFNFVESDVHFGNRVKLIADGHDLPFRSEVFDGVICQAVLEHVADPPRCVQEMHRVLKRRGLAYAEIPFMQQVHAKGYDFTRYTLGGFRRLFRNFREVEAGTVCGPAMALSWSISYFFGSFSSTRVWTVLKLAVLPFFIFWLKYFDYFLITKPSSSDAASGVFFLGYKSETPVSDLEILHKHWTYQK